jgi:hypothetical protein
MTYKIELRVGSVLFRVCTPAIRCQERIKPNQVRCQKGRYGAGSQQGYRPDPEVALRV